MRSDSNRLKLLKLKEKQKNYRVIFAKPPYLLMWYSVYGLRQYYDAYKGAELIHVAIPWLSLVSATSAALVTLTNGPCVMVSKKTNEENDEAAQEPYSIVTV